MDASKAVYLVGISWIFRPCRHHPLPLPFNSIYTNELSANFLFFFPDFPLKTALKLAYSSQVST